MAYILERFPILEALAAAGRPLDAGATVWMSKWRGLDLESPDQYDFPEISGSTSINFKIETVLDKKSRGTFVPTNSAGNPNTEIAYFNLASILGRGSLIRPAARYELGSLACARFKALILATPITGGQRLENKKKILAAIDTGTPLQGAVKAKKSDGAIALDAIADGNLSPNGGPRAGHAVLRALQAGNPQPVPGASITLAPGYVGDALTLAREYSIVMTLDAVLEQWDRYSGGNAGISKDDAGQAHFYMTDNGGAGPAKSGTWADRNLSWFSRYDRATLTELAQLRAFLTGMVPSYIGYDDPMTFIEDLGLYFRVAAQDYRVRLIRNLDKLAARAAAQAVQHGTAIYLPDIS